MSGIYVIQHSKDYLRPDEVARFFNVNERTVRNQMREMLEWRRFPYGRRIPVEAVVRLLRSGVVGNCEWPVRITLDEPLLRPETAAEKAGVTVATIYRWVEEGKIVAIDICQGKRATLRIPAGTLEPPPAEASEERKTPPDLEEHL